MKKSTQIIDRNSVYKKELEILARIKDLRTQKGFSQYELGEKLNISQNAYYKLEKGKTKLDLQRLIQLSTILEIELSNLVNT